MSTESSGEVTRVADALLSRIVLGKYPIGLRLPSEVELATELGCGRSTVREALSKLASAQVLVSRRGSGAHVRDWLREGTPLLMAPYLSSGLSADVIKKTLRELLAMRRMLAKEAVRLAVVYATDAALGEISERFLSGIEARKTNELVAAELDLYRELLVASELWPTVWFANTFWEPTRALHVAHADLLGGPITGYPQTMRRLLSAIVSRQEARALRLVDDYLEAVDAGLLEAFGEHAGAPKVAAGTARRGPARPKSRAGGRSPAGEKKRSRKVGTSC